MKTILIALVCCASALAQNITVKGDVPKEKVFYPEDLAKAPRQTVKMASASYEGVALRDLLQEAGVQFGHKMPPGNALAGYIVAKGSDGYRVVFSIGELDAAFGNAVVILADKVDGKALPEKQGPLRLVCPNDKAGARGVRMLEVIEVVKLAKPAGA